MFYRSVFMVIVSIIRLKLQKKKILPSFIRPLVIRNTLEMTAIISIFISVKLIPISTFVILFNSKGAIIYIFETIVEKKCPPISHVICCILSFVGMVMVISCLLYTSPSPRDLSTSRMPSSA